MLSAINRRLLHKPVLACRLPGQRMPMLKIALRRAETTSLKRVQHRCRRWHSLVLCLFFVSATWRQSCTCSERPPVQLVRIQPACAHGQISRIRCGPAVCAHSRATPSHSRFANDGFPARASRNAISGMLGLWRGALHYRRAEQRKMVDDLHGEAAAASMQESPPASRRHGSPFSLAFPWVFSCLPFLCHTYSRARSQRRRYAVIILMRITMFVCC